VSQNPPTAVPTGIVQKLEAYGYKAEAVQKWSKARAVTVLRTTEREERIAQYRLAASQGEPPDDDFVGEPLDVERLAAAEWLEEALAGNRFALSIAVMYATGHMRTDEVKRLAQHMVSRFREPSSGRGGPGRATRPPVATAAGGDGGG
jgi:hypothetical protein